MQSCWLLLIEIQRPLCHVLCSVPRAWVISYVLLTTIKTRNPKTSYRHPPIPQKAVSFLSALLLYYSFYLLKALYELRR